MGYNAGAFELGKLNLDKGKVDIAFDIFFDLAKNDLDEDALYMLTRMTFDGQLGPEQIEQFYEFQNSHSSYGNGYALYNVGLMHERGLGKVKQNYKVAVEYYEKAIKEEVHDAYCNLGNIYALGLGMEQGVPRDIYKGLELLSKGAESGSRQSAFTIGSLYGKGEFIPQDNSKAAYYLTLAAMMGHEQAKRVLAIFAHAHKNENFDREFDAANVKFGEIENLRKLYRCI
ncbi:MAG: tetratricopeptide repeat protein [Polynucleobacter sp.]